MGVFSLVYILDAHSIKTEMEGFEYIMVLPPSSRRQADVHRTSAFDWFKSLIETKNTHTPYGVWVFLAEMEGFEPPHALRRLADFESAPFSHLGTSPKTLVL